ncbi:unnamed protein product [Microthlaspi erraticum]|uniref:F-box domain-containing protein n=1 Tax=Microthlaspi erraticum TaxID=1685480 RepID=A0A6D2KWS2_9BRAS|nr:unnamed protein product [Microthlaspi erraticum]
MTLTAKDRMKLQIPDGSVIENKTPKDRNEVVPFNLQREILVRLPHRSLVIVRFYCVCKNWDLEVHEKDFIDFYYLGSMRTPRLLLSITPPTSDGARETELERWQVGQLT